MYSPRQIQCMQAIGLVPWVRRTAGETQVQSVAPDATEAIETVASESVVEDKAVADTLQPVLPSSQRSANTSEYSADQTAVCSGNMDAQVLLIFDVQSGADSWPLAKEDDALLDGMLRAIGLSKTSVCCCAILESSTERAALGSHDLSALCQAPRKHFLYFGGEDIAVSTVEPVAMRQSIQDTDTELTGWRLPALQTLREAPQRKRHAWVTLKQLRSALDHN